MDALGDLVTLEEIILGRASGSGKQLDELRQRYQNAPSPQGGKGESVGSAPSLDAGSIGGLGALDTHGPLSGRQGQALGPAHQQPQ